MKLISTIELENRSEQELGALFDHVSKTLVRTDRSTPDRLHALGSLENISRARAVRYTQRRMSL